MREDRPIIRTYRFKVYDRKYGGEPIDSGTIEALNKTEARKELKRNADVPRRARDSGFVPVRDWRIVLEERQ